MKRIPWLIFFLAIATARPSHAFLGWRDTLQGLWPAGPVQIDGRATEWSEMPVVEDGGVSFRAMNDESNLYLLLRGANDDGRILLSGRYRQNLTLWFLKPDHKTRLWGIDLDFSRAKPLDQEHPSSGAPTFADLGITPEKVLPQGLEISTTTFPSEIELQADLSSQHGRQPVYEMRIPLTLLERKGKSIYLDFVSSEVSPELKADLQASQAERTEEGSHGAGGSSSGGGGSGAMGGGRHHRGGGGSRGGGQKPALQLPNPVHVQLTIQLAKNPKH
jgi:uncharacterized membrane protein YgcG